MSVLMVDTKVYESIYNKIETYKNNKQCDINYCYYFSNSTNKENKKFIINLLKLNGASPISKLASISLGANFFSDPVPWINSTVLSVTN